VPIQNLLELLLTPKPLPPTGFTRNPSPPSQEGNEIVVEEVEVRKMIVVIFRCKRSMSVERCLREAHLGDL